VSLFRHSLELRLTVKITLLKVWNSALAVQVLYKHPALEEFTVYSQGVERNIGTQKTEIGREREHTQKIKRIFIIGILKV